MFGIHTVGMITEECLQSRPIEMGNGKLKGISQKFKTWWIQQKESNPQAKEKTLVVTSRHGRRAERGKIGLWASKRHKLLDGRDSSVLETMRKQPVFITANVE